MLVLTKCILKVFCQLNEVTVSETLDEGDPAHRLQSPLRSTHPPIQHLLTRCSTVLVCVTSNSPLDSRGEL